MIGVFAAADLFLFYVFWEVMLIPMYLLIGIWGGPRRIYAAVKFFLYTMVGSAADAGRDPVLLLRTRRGDAGDWTSPTLQPLPDLPLPSAAQTLAASRRSRSSFAIKVPMFPFHTWLPDAHVEAPTGGLGDPGRRPAEDRHLRLPALRDPALPGGARSTARRSIVGARGDRHRLRRADVRWRRAT